MKQSVTLKGSGEGYVLQLDDHAAFESILEELDVLLLHLKNKPKDAENVDESELAVTVQSGNRLLSEEEKKKITEKIEQNPIFSVKRFIADVVHIEDALNWHELNQMKIEMSNVRSGQIISAPGHVLVLGDIHPGGIVRAGRSIFVLGQLKGLAQAGCEGDDQSVVVANFNYNAQIRIGENVHIIEKNEEADPDQVGLRAAYMNDLHILEFTSLQTLRKLRSTLGHVIGRLE